MQELKDELAMEEPLEIRLHWTVNGKDEQRNISITMRTPGADEDLVLGFLFTEGIIQNRSQVKKAEHLIVPWSGLADPNVMVVTLKPDENPDIAKLERHFYTTSSCGVCGKSSIEAIHTLKRTRQLSIDWTVDAHWLTELPIRLREAQAVFESTGGLHASAFFVPDGALIQLREDVGRHNALDKLIGSTLKNGFEDWRQMVLLLSGRASFELIQKAAMAEIQVVAAVGAPSSLAVDLASDFGITLCGFLKSDRFNIYSHPQRIRS